MPELPPYRPPPKQPARELHLAQMMLPQNPKRVHPSQRLRVDMIEIKVPGLLSGEAPLATNALELPGTPRPSRIMVAGKAGLEIPWDSHPDMPALLIPATTAAEVQWQNRWRLSHFVSPGAIDLPFGRGALALAAWHALARVPHVEAVITELAYLASQVDALGFASAREETFLREMKLPVEVETRVKAEMSGKAPLLDARCLRWIVSELCAAWVCTRRVPPPDLTPAAEEVLGAFLPLLGRSGLPFRHEVYRAVWFLHDTFSLGKGPPGETDPDGLAMLTMTAAHSVGTRMFSEPDAHLLRAVEMWAIEDEDAAIAGRDVTPSAIREEFRRRTGMSVKQFLGVALFASHELRSRHRGASEDSLAALLRLLQYLAQGHMPDFSRTLQRHLTQTPRQLGRAVLAEMQRYKIPYQGLGSVPQHATEAVRDRPMLNVGQVTLPLGHSLFLDRAAQLPGVLYASRNGLRRRNVKGQIGHLFEARLQHRIQRLPANRMWVAGEQQLDAVVASGDQRPDAVLRAVAGQTFLAVEIHSGRLETGVASGNAPSVKKLLEEYLKKRRQATALAVNAAKVLGPLLGGGPVAPSDVVPLVVTDEALPTNPAFERAALAFAPEANPRFVCSVDEFELLLDLAGHGWDVGGLVRNWQTRGRGQMLGTFLQHAARVTPTGGGFTDRLIDAFFDRDDLNTAA